MPLRRFTPALLLLLFSVSASAQSTATISGQIFDSQGAAVPAAKITLTNKFTGGTRTTLSSDGGRYQIASVPVGNFRLQVQASGFRTSIIEGLNIGVAGVVEQDIRLEVGEISQEVVVSTATPLIERATTSVGKVIDDRALQELPLNGRHFIDLGLLIPGSVTPPQNGFLSPPARGHGSFALNTAGQREDTVNFQVNGINLNDQINNIITFLPPISSLQEFKVDNSTVSAEYGRNSGAIVNIATKQGTNQFHGELYEYFRNEVFDARNFFNFTSSEPPPFKRNQYGAAVGGPLILPRFGEGGRTFSYDGRNRTFFFFAYEGLRQRQGLDLNSLVLSDAQRLSVTDPVIRNLLNVIPRANFIDSSGGARFVGSTKAAVVVDQWTIDISHNLGKSDVVHGYFAIQRDVRNEPNLQGNTIPGFGDNRRGLRQIFTLNHTHVFDPALVNELRFGFNRIFFNASAGNQLNPAEFGIRNGINQKIGLPTINIAGEINFGGPNQAISGRGDTSFVVSDSLSLLKGQHSLKFGGEFRRFYSNLFLIDLGSFNFPTVAAFIAGNANSFSIVLGDRSSSTAQSAIDLFVQNTFRVRPNLSVIAGLRYEWNTAPTERFNRFVVFDPTKVSLVQVGSGIDGVYESNVKNFQPRLGLAWDPFRDGKTSVRAAYAIMTEQPLVNAVQNTAANPPFAIPLTVSGTVKLDRAIDVAGAAGLAPFTIDHGYENSYVQSWNLNVQRELINNLAIMVGYFGSKGTNLRISRNINQFVNGVRPFARLAASSPILPGTALGNITQVEGTGNSSYNALWSSVTHRFSSGLQITGSYTWSKSLDYNSLSSPPTVVTIQNSYDLRNDRGLSDFDATHRFVTSGLYELPFKGNQIKEGWQLGLIVQMQTGNPLNIITSNSTITGVANTVRPNVLGPVTEVGQVDRWFDTSQFVAVNRFGSLGRNVIIGPGFSNVDFSLFKTFKLDESRSIQFRFEAFDLFNQANFGQPGRVVGAQTFARITNTRFPTGDSGSSRQLQFVLKFSY